MSGFESGRIIGIHSSRQSARDQIEQYQRLDRMDEEGHEYLYTLRRCETGKTVATRWVKYLTEPTVWRQLRLVAYPLSEVSQ